MTARALVLLSLSMVALLKAASPPVEFREGDRIVLIGNTFIERAQSYGHLETWLTTALPDRTLSFRNLGWSGDTVFGDARSYFGPPKEGFDRLERHLIDLEPSLIISAYGAVAAFEGKAGLDDFIAGYRTLLKMFEATGARIVLMSPPPAENLPPPLPDQDEHNHRLAIYSQAIGKLADECHYGFADAFGTLKEAWPNLPHPLTDNGLHFTDAGYAAITPLIAKTLGVDPGPLSLEIDATTGKVTLSGAGLDALIAGTKAINVRLHPATATPRPMILKVTGLAGGKYTIANGHSPLTTASAKDLAGGISLDPGQWNRPHATLKRAIIEKNQLFFHRWRPQNETYLFGFRKHEQGNNAAEIPQFDPLIGQEEERIQKLKAAPSLTLSLRH